MSIITEALKKAEQERASKLKQETVAQEINTVLAEEEKVVKSFLEKNKAPEPAPHSSLTEFSKRNWFIGSAVVIFLVLYLLVNAASMKRGFSFLWYLFKNSKTLQTASIGIVYDRETYPTESAGFSNFAPGFVLSGISVQGEDRYAVINGKIVQKGDLIKGAFVKEILGREVTLETKTGELKLKVSS